MNILNKLKIKVQQIKLSRWQERWINTYIDAYGKAYIWSNGKQTRVLNPKEVIEINGKIS